MSGFRLDFPVDNDDDENQPIETLGEYHNNTTDNNTNTDVNDSSIPDLSSSFFPILPYGYTGGVGVGVGSGGIDLSGWFLQIGSKGSGRIETVFDHETQCEVIELTSNGINPLINVHQRNKTITMTRPGLSSNSRIALVTPRGTHSISEAITVKGSTGINNAREMSLTQRLYGLDMGTASMEPSNSNLFGDSTKGVNTRGSDLTLSKNLPSSPVHNRRKRMNDTGIASRTSLGGTKPKPYNDHNHHTSSTTSIQPSTTAATVASSSFASTSTSSSSSHPKPTETSIEFPHPHQFIGTSLPILNLQLKNVSKYISFEVEVEDVSGRLFQFEISNSSTIIRLRLDSTNLPLNLKKGWNRLKLNLKDLTWKCFQTHFSKVHRLKIFGSCRLRRIFFSNAEYPDVVLPTFLRIFSEEFYRQRREEEEEKNQSTTQQQQQQQQQQRSSATSPTSSSLPPPSSSSSPLPPSSKAPSRIRAQLRAELAAAAEMEDRLTASQLPSGHFYEQRLIDTQETRILARHAATQQSWFDFKQRTSRKLGIVPEKLNIHRTDLFRAKVEEFDLIEKSIPPSEKQGAGREESWSGSLRGIGHSYISIGNMFSGLNTKVQIQTNPKVEVIRRPNM